jgi:argonaute-like protein implicated in RNA metabolism and viral defense
MAMSLYVKSMRTPFVVDAVDPNAAYVGLGFSLDRKAEKGKHVVLGCSHLYNASGEGLQYRLTRLRDAIIDRQGNPYMSRDDARRVGETVRQLFYESRTRLPERVVLHKLTPFRKDEREGLAEGLGGVGQVDMLEINEDAALRYVTSSTKRDGSMVEGRFPIDRGTAVQIGKYEALLWIHGSAASLDPKKTYYQGKRRIPAPLLVRRHAGSAPLTLVAAEILSLSKMNLNSFYLYTKLPVTVQSSNEIARIGSLLQAHGGTTYDYRLFI